MPRHILRRVVTAGSVRRSSRSKPADRSEAGLWSTIRDELRARGLRWTPQRRLILDVLEAADGHVTGSELVERCRERDPDTTPSTVYRTLDVLEELGYIRHSHSAAGREEFHVLPKVDHAHLECRVCGGTWEMAAADATDLVKPLVRRIGFHPDVGHLTLSGTCAECWAAGNAGHQA
jgi:Fur family transcriptional regulator, ferric uptake regulator